MMEKGRVCVKGELYCDSEEPEMIARMQRKMWEPLFNLLLSKGYYKFKRDGNIVTLSMEVPLPKWRIEELLRAEEKLKQIQSGKVRNWRIFECDEDDDW